jgi:hypothetical protein
MAVQNISGFGGNSTGLQAFDELIAAQNKKKKASTTASPIMNSPFSSVGLGMQGPQLASQVAPPNPVGQTGGTVSPAGQPSTVEATVPIEPVEQNDQGLWNISQVSNVPNFNIMDYAYSSKPLSGGDYYKKKLKEGQISSTAGGLVVIKQGGELYQLDWERLQKEHPGWNIDNVNVNVAAEAYNRAPETMQITQDNWNYWKRHLDSLGHDTSNPAQWIGKSIATGYWSPVNVQGIPNPEEDKVYPGQDGKLYTYRNGKWFMYNIDKDLSNVSNKLNQMQNVEEPNLQSYDDALAGLQNLLSQMPTAENLYSASQEAAARRLDFASADEMYQTQGDMFGQMQEGIGGGDLSITQQRQMNMESQRMRGDYQKIMESLSASGRSVAALQQADAMVATIADQRLKTQLEYENLNFAQRQAEYAALSERWDALFKNGSIAAQEYLDAQTKYWTDYISGYATMIGAISEANQGMLQAQAQHAQILYSGILAELGVDAQALEMSNQLYEEYLAPYYKKLEEMGINAQIDAAKAEQGMSLAGMILGTLGAVLGGLAGGIGQGIGEVIAAAT